MHCRFRMSLKLLGVCAVLSACTTVPEPLSRDQLDAIAADRLQRVVTDQEPITGPIGLYEAMARALKYNLDYKVEVMEQALRVEELDLANVDRLPTLVANAGYSDRDNDSGGRSISLLTGRESLEPSTSVERQHTVSDLTLSWDVLDFGLSYVRAKQRGDDVLVAMERRRKVANRIVEDVRTAYWRAISSDRLISKLEELDDAVDEALSDSQDLEKRRKSSPLDALTYQRELVSVRLQIKALHHDVAVAKRQLAALMNVPPGTDFELAAPENLPETQELDVDVDQLVAEALRNRSELRELDYRMRINGRETKAALLELLPGLKLYGGLNWDTNRLLFNDDWTAWGARLNWNLINAFRYPKQKSKIAAEEALLDQQALATAMAIMTQVHVSLARYQLLNEEFEANATYLDIQSGIDEKVTASRDSGRLGQQRWIRERMNTLVASLKHDIAYAGLQNIYANIYASIGYDAFPNGIDGNESVAELGEALERHWATR